MAKTRPRLSTILRVSNSNNYRFLINQSIDNAGQLNSINDEPYSLALTAYALALAKSAKANAAWDKYFALVKKSDGVEFWLENN